MISLTSTFDSIYFLAKTGPRNVFFDSIVVIMGIAVYIFTSYCFQKIYQKLGEPNAWFAWVPLLQYWIMYKAGNRSPWWLIGLFIPIVNIFASINLLVAFFRIVDKLGKNPWLIFLMIIPLANFWVMYHFAFT